MRKTKLSIGIIFFVQILFCSRTFAAQMSVYYINVGQGDAEYIELPNGKNLLIDGGPNSSTLPTNPLINFFDSKGVTTINYVVLSHPHSDHYSGLYAAFQKYKVEKFYDTGVDNPNSSKDDSIRNYAKAISGCYQLVLSTGNFPENPDWGCEAAILHTSTAVTGNFNDNSVVFRIKFGSSTFIFGGDASTNIENYLTANYGDVLQTDCYKVHHHGSSTSSTESFLAKLKPKYAFIEVGANSYGHPTLDAVNRLKTAGVTRIYYTGNNPYGSVDGTVQVVTVGDGSYAITPNYVPPIVDLPQPQKEILNSTYITLFNNLFHPDRQEWTELQYYISQAGEMDVKIFTLDGEVVKHYERFDANPGTYFWAWNGKNRDEDTASAGVYIVRIKTADAETTKKAILIR
ncbi:MAG: MBL fold metallo-hydrolase [Elusimicrobia bacterium]|nr:MBL fold metallo-hydrolase [Elusimicrobiota bacterium]